VKFSAVIYWTERTIPFLLQKLVKAIPNVKLSAIALTNCMCKTIERKTNARLVWFLESNGLLPNVQCEFRQGRNTLDHLVSFETFI